MRHSKYTIEEFKKKLNEDDRQKVSRLEIQVGVNGIVNSENNASKISALYVWCPDCLDTEDKDGCWGAEKIKAAESTNREELLKIMEEWRFERNGAPFDWEII
jgi:hypothetical protein